AEDHACALADEHARLGHALPLRSAADQGHLAVESSHECLLGAARECRGLCQSRAFRAVGPGESVALIGPQHTPWHLPGAGSMSYRMGSPGSSWARFCPNRAATSACSAASCVSRAATLADSC